MSFTSHSLIHTNAPHFSPFPPLSSPFLHSLTNRIHFFLVHFTQPTGALHHPPSLLHALPPRQRISTQHSSSLPPPPFTSTTRAHSFILSPCTSSDTHPDILLSFHVSPSPPHPHPHTQGHFIIPSPSTSATAPDQRHSLILLSSISPDSQKHTPSVFSPPLPDAKLPPPLSPQHVSNAVGEWSVVGSGWRKVLGSS